MLIAIQDYYLYASLGLAFLLFISSLMIFVMIKNNCPDAFTHWKASVAEVQYVGSTIAVSKQKIISHQLIKLSANLEHHIGHSWNRAKIQT